MNWRKVYIKIIHNAQKEATFRQTQYKIYKRSLNLFNKNKSSFILGYYYENHHILPKSLFPLWEKRKSNLVLLTAREHFFCHQLLNKIYSGEKMLL
ncbi:MAG: hypothetical protein LBF97_05560, partial [Elusimicrobiota bacterium]|nr:hypothetical protein [Elusimicrobiota bacterium]